MGLLHKVLPAAGGGSSAPSIVAHASAFDSSGTSTFTCDIPTGTANGDLMVAFLLSSSSGGNFLLPSGWTNGFDSKDISLTPGGGATRIVYKIAASEGSSVTFSASSSSKGAVIVTFRNAKWGGLSPVKSASSGAIVTPDAVYVEDKGFVIGWWGNKDGSITYTTPSGMTSLVADSSGTGPSSALFYKAITATGSSGTFSSDPSGSSTNFGQLISILPSGSATPTGAIVRVNSESTHNTTTSSSLVISKPAGVVEGDLMLAFMSTSGTTARTWTGASGWTEVADQNAYPNLRVAYKIATSSEPSSYTFTASTSTTYLAGGILALRNATYAGVGSIPSATGGVTVTAPTTTQNVSALFAAFASPEFSPIGSRIGVSSSYFVSGDNLAASTTLPPTMSLWESKLGQSSNRYFPIPYNTAQTAYATFEYDDATFGNVSGVAVLVTPSS